MVTDEEYLELQNAYNALLDEHFDQKSVWINQITDIRLDLSCDQRPTFYINTPQGRLTIEALTYHIEIDR
jgi:hypothetical protein